MIRRDHESGEAVWHAGFGTWPWCCRSLGLLAAGRARARGRDRAHRGVHERPGPHRAGPAAVQQQCVKCHGKGAYPGKAPKLKVKKLSPEDIYLRVTYGYGKMPAWEDVFTDEERMAITAYMKSPHFSN